MAPSRRARVHALLSIGCMAVAAVVPGCDRVDEAPAADAVEVPAVRVRVDVASVRRGQVSRAETSTGVVQPWQRAAIVAEVGGKLVDVRVDVGDTVEAGQTLVRIDDSRQRIGVAQSAAQVRSAAADLAFARTDVERKRPLVERGSLASIALEEAEHRVEKALAAAESAEATARSARRQLVDTTLKSPFAAVVTARRVDPGATIAPGMVLLELVDLSRVRVRVGVTGAEVAGLSIGDEARVRVADLGGAELAVQVGAVGAVANPATGLFEIELRGENSRGVRGGMLATVDLPRRSVENALVVPRSAMTRRDGRVVAFEIVDGVARTRILRTGLYDADEIEVHAGLEPGAVVASSALHALAEGVLVVPTPRATPDGRERADGPEEEPATPPTTPVSGGAPP